MTWGSSCRLVLPADGFAVRPPGVAPPHPGKDRYLQPPENRCADEHQDEVARRREVDSTVEVFRKHFEQINDEELDLIESLSRDARHGEAGVYVPNRLIRSSKFIGLRKKLRLRVDNQVIVWDVATTR